MNRIDAAFASLKAAGRTALVPYVTVGDPTPAHTLPIMKALVTAGADVIELGVPFSDPLADGPVIHAAATRALEAGATLERVLSICERLAGQAPVVPMVYANMVLARGPGEFARLLADAGAAGVIVPDLPLEETGEIRTELSGAGIPLVPLVAPTTPPERRGRICERAEGFVYVVSTVGVTGEREELPPELTGLIEAVRADAEVPVAVGFGIGTAEQAAAVGGLADGIIIGSKLVRLLSDAPDEAAAAESLTGFLGEVRAALAG